MKLTKKANIKVVFLRFMSGCLIGLGFMCSYYDAPELSYFMTGGAVLLAIRSILVSHKDIEKPEPVDV